MACKEIIAIGADHAGFEFKKKIKQLLKNLGYTYDDCGTNSTKSSDYPRFAHKVAKKVSTGIAKYGILICGTGIGMSITANKHKNIRAAVVESVKAAKLSRQHNDANVLAIGARIIPWKKAEEIIKIFLATDFEGGRHQKRIEKIDSFTNI